MTIQEMAQKWSHEKCPVSPDSQTFELDEFMNRMYNEQYIEIATEVLTSLLEELPDTFDEYGMGKDAQSYRNEIKSLIQTKLK